MTEGSRLPNTLISAIVILLGSPVHTGEFKGTQIWEFCQTVGNALVKFLDDS